MEYREVSNKIFFIRMMREKVREGNFPNVREVEISLTLKSQFSLDPEYVQLGLRRYFNSRTIDCTKTRSCEKLHLPKMKTRGQLRKLLV